LRMGPVQTSAPAASRLFSRPSLYVRRDTVAALAEMKPLSPEAKRALIVALKDKNSDVRSTAASALQSAGGEAEQAALAEQKREEQIYAQRSKPDARRYNKQQIVAAIPADADHEYPLALAYLYPIYPIGGSAQQAVFLITLHSGKDRPERLVFWKKVGDDQYQRVKVIEPEDPDFAEDHFDAPITFTAKVRVYDGQYDDTELFVDVPMDGWRSHIDQVFAIDGEELHPVEIESPEKRYKDKLGSRESVRYPAGNSFSDGHLEWSFGIWNADDPMCCPTAGRAVGTYKIIKETPASGAALGGYVPGTGEIVRSEPPTGAPAIRWKMVVDGANRETLPRPVKPSTKREATPKGG
jgi:hypothetical protein